MRRFCTGLFKNFNYAREDSPDYASLLEQIDKLADSVTAYAASTDGEAAQP